MALFNYATKEITLKIVYYGPGLSGKTTNLQHLHSVLNADTKGRLLSLSTESDRTLFFDFLPVELGKIRDFSIRFQLYTVPGQVRYNATRKVVLKGADGVVFVADSQIDMRDQNIESFENMKENLLSNNINPDEIPIVLQYNKRDLKSISSREELDTDLNSANYPVIQASAIDGTGVEDSFRLITKLLLKYISRKHHIEIQPAKGSEVAAQESAPKPEAAAPEIHVSPRPVIKAPAAPPERIDIPVSSRLKVEDVMPVEHIPSFTDLPSESEPPAAVEQEKAAASESKEVRVIPADEVEVKPDGNIPSFRELTPESKPAVEAERQEVVITESAEAPIFPAGEVEVEPLENIPSFREQVLEEKPAFAVERDREAVSEIREVPVFPAEKIDRIIDEVTKISGVLTDLKNSVYVLSKEMKDLKEVRKEQAETNRILLGIARLFEELKEKKSWFRF